MVHGRLCTGSWPKGESVQWQHCTLTTNTPCRIRTCDHRLRRPTFYPTELTGPRPRPHVSSLPTLGIQVATFVNMSIPLDLQTNLPRHERLSVAEKDDYRSVSLIKSARAPRRGNRSVLPPTDTGNHPPTAATLVKRQSPRLESSGSRIALWHPLLPVMQCWATSSLAL